MAQFFLLLIFAHPKGQRRRCWGQETQVWGLPLSFPSLGGWGKLFTLQLSLSPSVKWGGSCSLCRDSCQGQQEGQDHTVSCWVDCKRPHVPVLGQKCWGPQRTQA